MVNVLCYRRLAWLEATVPAAGVLDSMIFSGSAIIPNITLPDVTDAEAEKREFGLADLWFANWNYPWLQFHKLPKQPEQFWKWRLVLCSQWSPDNASWLHHFGLAIECRLKSNASAKLLKSLPDPPMPSGKSWSPVKNTTIWFMDCEFGNSITNSFSPAGTKSVCN